MPEPTKKTTMINKNPTQGATGSGGTRQSAKMALDGQIKRVKAELRSLEILSNKIHWDELSAEEEQDLWSYFVTLR